MKTPSYLASGAAALSLVLVWWSWHQGADTPHRKTQTSIPGHSPAAHMAPSPGATQKKSTHAVMLCKLENNEASFALTPDQLATYVEQKHHSVASLLAAWHLGHDKKWLDEAAAADPDNPRVALAELESGEMSPDDRKEWITRLQQNAPENAIGWCYAAADAFKDGRTEEAKAALADATMSDVLDVYGKQSARDYAEAYRSAGYDGLAAEILGQAYVSLPQAALVMGLTKTLTDVGISDADTLGDMRSLAQMVRGADAGGQPLISPLVAIAAERKLLGTMNADDLAPGSDTSVGDRLAALNAERTTIRDVVAQAQPLMPTLTDSELKQYLRRGAVEGELKALQWVIQTKHAK